MRRLVAGGVVHLYGVQKSQLLARHDELFLHGHQLAVLAPPLLVGFLGHALKADGRIPWVDAEDAAAVFPGLQRHGDQRRAAVDADFHDLHRLPGADPVGEPGRFLLRAPSGQVDSLDYHGPPVCLLTFFLQHGSSHPMISAITAYTASPADCGGGFLPPSPSGRGEFVESTWPMIHSPGFHPVLLNGQPSF